MHRLCLVLLGSFVATACAANRENLAATGAAAPPPPALTAASTSAPESAAAAQPSTIVDGNALAQRTLPICREILRPGSNVIITQCMSAENWKAYERREEREAQEIVRMLQGGRYR
jgi:hypothetical protein